MAMTRIKRELLQLALGSSGGGGGGSTPIIPSEYTQYESTYKLTIGTAELPSSGIYNLVVRADADTARKFAVGDKVCIKAPYATSSSASSILGYAYFWGTVTSRSIGPVYADVTLNPVEGFILNPTDAIPSASNITANGYKNYILGFGGVRVDVPSTLKVYQNLTFASLPVAGQQLVQVLDTNVNRLDAVGLMGSYNGNDYAVYGVVTAKNNATAYINVSNVIQLQAGGATPIVPLPAGTTLVEGTKMPITKVKNMTYGGSVTNLQVPEGTAIAVNDVVCIHEIYKTQDDLKTYGDAWILGTVTKVTTPEGADALVDLSNINFILKPTSTLPTREITENGVQKIVGYGEVNVDVQTQYLAGRKQFLSDPTDQQTMETSFYAEGDVPSNTYIGACVAGEYNGTTYAVFGTITAYDESADIVTLSISETIGGGGGVPSKADVHMQIYEFTSDPTGGAGTTITFRTDDDTQADPTIEEAIQISASCNGLFVQGSYNGSSEKAGEYLVHFPTHGLPYFDESSHVYSGVCDLVYKVSLM